MSVPPWKQALMERRKQKDTEEQQKQVKEDEQLANLPAWKRAIILKQREKEKKDAAVTSAKPEPQNTPSRSNSFEIRTAAAIAVKSGPKTETLSKSESFEKRTVPVLTEKSTLPKSESFDKLAKPDLSTERRTAFLPKSPSFDMLAKRDLSEKQTADLLNVAKVDSSEQQTATATVLPKSPSFDKLAKPDSSAERRAAFLPKSPSFDMLAKPYSRTAIIEKQTVDVAKASSTEQQTAVVLPKSPSFDKLAKPDSTAERRISLPKSPSSDILATSERQTMNIPRSESIGKLAAAFSKPDLPPKSPSTSTIPRPEPPGKAIKATTPAQATPAQATPAPTTEAPKDTAKQAQSALSTNAGRTPVPSSYTPSSGADNKAIHAQQPTEQQPVTEVRVEQRQASLLQTITSSQPQTSTELPAAVPLRASATHSINLPSDTNSGQETSPPTAAVTSQPSKELKRRSLEEESIKAPVPAWKKALLERKRSNPSLPVAAAVGADQEPERAAVMLKPIKQASKSDISTVTPTVTPTPGVTPTITPTPTVTPTPAVAPTIASTMTPVITPPPVPVSTPKVTPGAKPKLILPVTPIVTPKVAPADTPKVTTADTPKLAFTPKVTPADTPKLAITPKVTPADTPKGPVASSILTSVNTPKVIPVTPLSGATTAPGLTPPKGDMAQSTEQRKTSFSTPSKPAKPQPGGPPQRKLSAPPALPPVKPPVPQRTPSLLSPPPTPTATVPIPSPLSSPPSVATPPPPPVPEVVSSETKEPLKLLQREGVELRPPIFQEVKEWANVSESDPQFLSLPQWKKALILRRREDIAKRSGLVASPAALKPTADQQTASTLNQPAGSDKTTAGTSSQMASKPALPSAGDSNNRIGTGDLAANDKAKPQGTSAGYSKTSTGTLASGSDKVKSGWSVGNDKARSVVNSNHTGANSNQSEEVTSSTEPASVKALLGKFGPKSQAKNTTPSTQVIPFSGKLTSPSGSEAFFPTRDSTPEPAKVTSLKPNLFSPPPDQLSPMRPSSGKVPEPPSPALPSSPSPDQDSEDSDIEVTNIDDVLDEEIEDGGGCSAPTLVQLIQSDAFLPQQSASKVSDAVKTNGLDQTSGLPVSSVVSNSSKFLSPAMILSPPTSPQQKSPPTSPTDGTNSAIKSILVGGEVSPKKKPLRRVSWSDSSLVVQHTYPKYTYDDYDETEGIKEEDQEGSNETDGGGQVLALPVHPMLQTNKANRDLYSAQPMGSPQSTSLHNYKPSVIASYGSLLGDHMNDKGYLSSTEGDRKEPSAGEPSQTVAENDDKSDQASSAYSADVAALIW